LLLDTHALPWLAAGDDRLGNTVRQMIEDVETAVSVSVVSLWEIAVKARLGKLRVNQDRLSQVLRGAGVRRLDILDRHLNVLRALPQFPDHRLISQAIAEAMVFVTADRRVARYAVETLSCGA